MFTHSALLSALLQVRKLGHGDKELAWDPPAQKQQRLFLNESSAAPESTLTPVLLGLLPP